MNAPLHNLGSPAPSGSDDRSVREAGLRALWPLWRMLRPQVGSRFATGTSLVFLASALGVVGPFMLRNAVDTVTARKVGDAALFIVAYAATVGASRAMQIILVWLEGSVWRRTQRVASRTVYQHVIDLPHRFHVEQATGELNRVIGDGLNGLHSVLSALMFSMLPVFFQIGMIGIVFAGVRQPGLLAVILAFSVLYGFVFHRGTIRQRRIQRTAVKADAVGSGIVGDALLNIEAVKLFTAEDLVLERMESAIRKSETAWIEFLRARVGNGLFLAGLLVIALVALLSIAAHLVSIGTMTAGDFVLVNAYVLQIIAPIERLGFASRELTQGLTYIERMMELLSERTEVSLGHGGRSLPGAGPLSIEIQGLWFGYDPMHPVLKGISCDLPAGKTIAVVGSSGSGKSTLSRLLSRPAFL